MKITQPWRFINCFLGGFITGVGLFGLLLQADVTPFDNEPESSYTATLLGYIVGCILFIGLVCLAYKLM